MSVFKALTEEHRLLWGLAARLESALSERDDRVARRDARAVLLVLLRALEGHQELEDLVFAEAGKGASPAAVEALAFVEHQHKGLEVLHREAVDLLEAASDLDPAALRPLARRLSAALREHFETEERDLWPRWNAAASRSSLRGLEHRAAARVTALKREVRGWWAAVDEYLSS
jgi:hypothetical protein